MTRSGYDKWKRNVLRCCLNRLSRATVQMSRVMEEFQKLAPETGKARLPTVERLNGGTARWLGKLHIAYMYIIRQGVPSLWASNWECTATDHVTGGTRRRLVPVERSDRLPGRLRTGTHERSKLRQCTSVKNSVCQQGDLIQSIRSETRNQ